MLLALLSTLGREDFQEAVEIPILRRCEHMSVSLVDVSSHFRDLVADLSLELAINWRRAACRFSEARGPSSLSDSMTPSP